MYSGWPTCVNIPVWRVSSRDSNSFTTIQSIVSFHGALRESSNLTLHHKNYREKLIKGYRVSNVNIFTLKALDLEIDNLKDKKIEKDLSYHLEGMQGFLVESIAFNFQKSFSEGSVLFSEWKLANVPLFHKKGSY